MPDAKQWQSLRALLQAHTAKWMLWERTPLPASVDKLQALGVQSIVVDPCGNVPAQGDFLNVMQHNVANIRQAFQ